MAATISNLMTPDGGDSFYGRGLFEMMYAYVPYFSKTGKIQYITPNDAILYKYDGDFYGLLDILGVPKQYHFITLLMNSLRASGDYSSKVIQTIVIPDITAINLLESTYSTISKIS